MFDLGWSEILLIAAVTLVVIGPREIPRVLRTVRGMLAKVRSISTEFQNTMEQAAREADLVDLKKDLLKEGQELCDVKDDSFDKIVQGDIVDISQKFAEAKSTLKDVPLTGEPKQAEAKAEEGDNTAQAVSTEEAR